jgi:rod shape-determining protein MreC
VVVYQRDRRRRVTLALLVLTSIVLISLDQRGSGLLNTTRSGVQDVIAPVQHLADDAINPAVDWVNGLGRADELQDENQRLRRKLAEARTAAAAGIVASARLRELDKLFDLPTIADYDGVVANVVAQGEDPLSLGRSFQIDKGSDAGLAVDMPVVAGGGALVGRIARVWKTGALVQRIDDRGFGAGARLATKSLFSVSGTASGQENSSLLAFSVVGTNVAGVVIRKGTLAVTTGLAGEPFPKDLPIGTIVHTIEAGGAIAHDAELRPIVDLDSLDVVKVLKYRPAAP